MECVACTGRCEAPFTYVEDAAGRLTGEVVCLACLPEGEEVTDEPVELGGEGG